MLVLPLVDPQQLVDEVGLLPPDQDINLVENQQQMTVMCIQVATDGLDNLA